MRQAVLFAVVAALFAVPAARAGVGSLRDLGGLDGCLSSAARPIAGRRSPRAA